MDQRERINDYEETFRTAFAGAASELYTALPAKVTAVHSNGTLDAQPTIQGRVQKADGTFIWQNLPLCINCPILYMGGGGFVATFPITAGDEVLLIFASRCIDAWWQQGGIQQQLSPRVMSLEDGFALCGPRSQANLVPNLNAATMQVRSLDGTQYIELAAGGVVNIVAPGGVHITGDVTVTGKVTASKEGTFNGGHTVSAHKHGGVATGTATTATPAG